MAHNAATGLLEKANDVQVTLTGDASLVVSAAELADVDWTIGTPASGWVVGEVTV